MKDHLAKAVGNQIADHLWSIIVLLGGMSVGLATLSHFVDSLSNPHLRILCWFLAGMLCVVAYWHEGRRQSEISIDIAGTRRLSSRPRPLMQWLPLFLAVLFAVIAFTEIRSLASQPVVLVRNQSFTCESFPLIMEEAAARNICANATAYTPAFARGSPQVTNRSLMTHEPHFHLHVRKADGLDESVLSKCSVNLMSYTPFHGVGYQHFEEKNDVPHPDHRLLIALRPKPGEYLPHSVIHKDREGVLHSSSWQSGAVSMRDSYWNSFIIGIHADSPGYYTLNCSMTFFAASRRDETITVSSSPITLAVVPSHLVVSAEDNFLIDSTADKLMSLPDHCVTLTYSMEYTPKDVTRTFLWLHPKDGTP